MDLVLIFCWQKMADSGVVTRYRGTELHCSECLRVTVGTEDENQQFLKLLVETWGKLN
jgi:histidinol-phosphate aminotransferase